VSRHRNYLLISIILFGTAHARINDSTGVPDTVSAVKKTSMEKTWNPVFTGGLSAAIPGGGQFYTGHYIKAGSFLALEAITASVAVFWRRTEIGRNRDAESFRDLAGMKLSWSDSLIMLEQSTLMRFDALSARYTMYNSLSWMVGGYIYNILDAIGSSRYFVSDKEKSPFKAAWLAALPGLGLGQIYNGSISKAGVIMMVQTSLGVKAFNEHRLMKEAEKHFTAALSIKDSLDATPVADAWNDDWDSRRKTASRNRNSYLWYSLFFYFYTIADAVVDAHLHDYPQKIRAYPDLMPEQSAVRMNIDYLF
jgi:hypothetical protein